MAAKYIFRLDDICPTMNWEAFDALEKIFSRYDIQPIIGVIPDNRDTALIIQPEHVAFWKKMRELHQKRWIIAQHGYQHRYVTSSGGILNINKKSEFSGLSYQEQYQKIKAGKEVLEEKIGVKIDWWMAPAHSFDQVTCKVLQDLNFRYITDGIALFPFEKYGLIWIPQQLWKPRKKFFGIWTICIHPNSITPHFLGMLEQFISENKENCKTNEDLVPKFSYINYMYKYWWKFQYFLYKILIR